MLSHICSVQKNFFNNKKISFNIKDIQILADVEEFLFET